MSAPDRRQRTESQRLLDKDQALLDVDQAVVDRARLRLDYQQAEADIGEARTARERSNAPWDLKRLFDSERASRSRGQSAQDAQDIDLDGYQDSVHERQADQDGEQRAHDKAATAEQSELEREARDQRERARRAREDALSILERSRQARDEARRLRDEATR